MDRKRSMSYLTEFENIGEHIKRALQKRNKNQVWLSEKLEIDKTHVSKWVNNHVRPSAKYLNEIVEVLDFEISEIITGKFNDEVRLYPVSADSEAEANETIYNEELQLIESYINRIIESDSDAEMINLKTKLLNIVRAII